MCNVFPSMGKATRCLPLCKKTLGIFQINKLTFFFFLIIPWRTFPTQIIVGCANMVIKTDILLSFNTLFKFALFFSEITKNWEINSRNIYQQNPVVIQDLLLTSQKLSLHLFWVAPELQILKSIGSTIAFIFILNTDY